MPQEKRQEKRVFNLSELLEPTKAKPVMGGEIPAPPEYFESFEGASLPYRPESAREIKQQDAAQRFFNLRELEGMKYEPDAVEQKSVTDPLTGWDRTMAPLASGVRNAGAFAAGIATDLTDSAIQAGTNLRPPYDKPLYSGTQPRDVAGGSEWWKKNGRVMRLATYPADLVTYGFKHLIDLGIHPQRTLELISNGESPFTDIDPPDSEAYYKAIDETDFTFGERAVERITEETAMSFLELLPLFGAMYKAKELGEAARWAKLAQRAGGPLKASGTLDFTLTAMDKFVQDISHLDIEKMIRLYDRAKSNGLLDQILTARHRKQAAGAAAERMPSTSAEGPLRGQDLVLPGSPMPGFVEKSPVKLMRQEAKMGAAVGVGAFLGSEGGEVLYNFAVESGMVDENNPVARQGMAMSSELLVSILAAVGVSGADRFLKWANTKRKKRLSLTRREISMRAGEVFSDITRKQEGVTADVRMENTRRQKDFLRQQRELDPSDPEYRKKYEDLDKMVTALDEVGYEETLNDKLLRHLSELEANDINFKLDLLSVSGDAEIAKIITTLKESYPAIVDYLNQSKAGIVDGASQFLEQKMRIGPQMGDSSINEAFYARYNTARKIREQKLADYDREINESVTEMIGAAPGDYDYERLMASDPDLVPIMQARVIRRQQDEKREEWEMINDFLFNSTDPKNTITVDPVPIASDMIRALRESRTKGIDLKKQQVIMGFLNEYIDLPASGLAPMRPLDKASMENGYMEGTIEWYITRVGGARPVEGELEEFLAILPKKSDGKLDLGKIKKSGLVSDIASLVKPKGTGKGYTLDSLLTEMQSQYYIPRNWDTNDLRSYIQSNMAREGENYIGSLMDGYPDPRWDDFFKRLATQPMAGVKSLVPKKGKTLFFNTAWNDYQKPFQDAARRTRAGSPEQLLAIDVTKAFESAYDRVTAPDAFPFGADADAGLQAAVERLRQARAFYREGSAGLSGRLDKVMQLIPEDKRPEVFRDFPPADTWKLNPIAAITRRGIGGGYEEGADKVFTAYLQKADKGFQAADLFIAVMGDDRKAMEAMKQSLISKAFMYSFDPKTQTLNHNRLRAFTSMSQYGPMMNRYPTLKKDFQQLVELRTKQLVESKKLKDLDDYYFKQEHLRLFMRDRDLPESVSGDVNSVMSYILSRPRERAPIIARIKRELVRDPATGKALPASERKKSLESLRQAYGKNVNAQIFLGDYGMTNSRRTLDLRDPVKAKAYYTRTHPVARLLYSEKELDAVNTYLDRLIEARNNAEVQGAGESTSLLKVFPGLTMSKVQSRYWNVKRQIIGKGYVGTDVSFTYLRNKYSQWTADQASEILTQAVYNPEIALDLERLANAKNMQQANRVFRRLHGYVAHLPDTAKEGEKAMLPEPWVPEFAKREAPEPAPAHIQPRKGFERGFGFGGINLPYVP